MQDIKVSIQNSNAITNNKDIYDTSQSLRWELPVTLPWGVNLLYSWSTLDITNGIIKARYEFRGLNNVLIFFTVL